MASKFTAAAVVALSASTVHALSNPHGAGGAPHAHHARAPSPTITSAPVAYAEFVARDATITTVDPATTSPAPLTDYQFPYSALPYKVNPYPVLRGPQSGYNQCNSTTEGADSQCQTLVINSIEDFCLWGSPTANGEIGSIEAAAVAYCVKSGHGSRVMPAGTITGLQFMRTSKYIQITGHLKQSGVGLTDNDTGGELDPHGADLLGNPLGGLVYSTGLPSGDNTTYAQVLEWNNFVGGGTFCFKACDPNQGPDNYCENRYDLVGCSYNMPAAYKDGEFTSCEGELQDIVGRYVGTDGQTTTWKQPEPLTETPPYQPRIPASSNCVTYSSAQLFGSASATATASGSGASASATASGSRGASGSASGSRTSSGSAASATSSSSGASRTVVGAGAAFAAVVFGALVAL